MSVPPIPDEVVRTVIDGYTAGIKPCIAYIAMGSLLSTMMLPIIFILCYFSSPGLRKQPIFILNIMSLVAGWLIGVGNAYMEITSLLSPFTGVAHPVYTVWTAAYTFLPWLAELTLLFRLIAVYPPRRVGRVVVASILIFPILIKITRVTVNSLFFVRWVRITSTTTNLIDAAKTVWLTTPYTRIEWICQLIDNSYVSGVFLWKLHKDGRIFDRSATGVVNSSSASFTSRIRTLFWIGATNFILPVAFNVVQVVIVFRSRDIYKSTYVLMANVYIVTISTVLATVWSSLGSHQTDTAPKPRVLNRTNVTLGYSRGKRTGSSAGDGGEDADQPERGISLRVFAKNDV